MPVYICKQKQTKASNGKQVKTKKQKTQVMKDLIADIKQKLPKRGYAPLIKEELGKSRSKRAKSITTDKIHKLFNGRSIDPLDADLIVKKAATIISNQKKSERQLRRLLRA